VSDIIRVLRAIAICHHFRIQFRLADCTELIATSPSIGTNPPNHASNSTR
jgi:hypothetical protein